MNGRCGPLGRTVIVKGPLAVGSHGMPRTGALKAKPEEDGGQSAPWAAWREGVPARAKPPLSETRPEPREIRSMHLGLVMRMRQNC